MHSDPFYLIAAAGAIAAVPLAAGLFTSYLKVSIVFGMLRSALGTQQAPGPLLTSALSLAVTCQVMAPVAQASLDAARNLNLPAIMANARLEDLEKIKPALAPWKSFLFMHAGEREMRAMLDEETIIRPPPASADTISLRALMAAFLLTEVREAFAMSFVLLLPFLVIDLTVANILAGMGMFMVSPVMITLPLKLLLFVQADGWILLTKSLIRSYGG